MFKKSTMIMLGYKGSFIAFEAKTTNENRLKCQHIKTPKIEYLK